MIKKLISSRIGKRIQKWYVESASIYPIGTTIFASSLLWFVMYGSMVSLMVGSFIDSADSWALLLFCFLGYFCIPNPLLLWMGAHLPTRLEVFIFAGVHGAILGAFVGLILGVILQFKLAKQKREAESK